MIKSENQHEVYTCPVCNLKHTGPCSLYNCCKEFQKLSNLLHELYPDLNSAIEKLEVFTENLKTMKKFGYN